MCDERAEVYNVTRPRAVKDHVCTTCRGAIRRGEVYCRRNYVFDGSAGTDKVCDLCVAVDAHLAEGRDHACTLLGAYGLHEDLCESMDFLPEGIGEMRLTTREMALLYAMHHKVPVLELEHETEGMQRKRLQGTV